MKWRVTSRLIGGAHDMEPNARQGSNPAFLVTFDMKAKALIDSFIGAFASAV